MKIPLTITHIFLVVFMLLVGAQSLRAQDITGKWYRREGGNVVDVMIVEKVGRGYHVTFKENEQSAPYSEAHGYFRDGTLWMALMSMSPSQSSYFGVYQLTSNGTFTGKSLRKDGTVSWEGTFVR
jgi:uncharacterized protein (DUF2147 family)